MTKLHIYDNGGETLDRYTIVYGDKDERGFFECIGASQTGAGVYLHSDCTKGRHLGKKITFNDLDKDLQRMLADEFEYNIYGVDWIEKYDLLPVDVQAVMSELGEDSDYPELDAANLKLNELGWSIDYYLDATPFDLKPIKK
jgi:hypothetical protein